MQMFAVWRHHPVLGWHAYQPALGDKLWLWIGRIRHYGIFAGYDVQGWPLMVHNTRRGGVCEERLRGDETFYFEEPIDATFPGDQILARARSLIGRPWWLITFNCEQFSNWCQTGRRVSVQVNQALFWTAIAGIVLWGTAQEQTVPLRRSQRRRYART